MERVEFQGLPAAWQPGLGQMFVFKHAWHSVRVYSEHHPLDKRQTIETLLAKVVGRL